MYEEVCILKIIGSYQNIDNIIFGFRVGLSLSPSRNELSQCNYSSLQKTVL